MKMKHRRTGEILQGTLELRGGRPVMILENGRIVDVQEYELIREGLERVPAWAIPNRGHDDDESDDEEP